MARTFTPQELGLVPLVEQEKKKNVFTPAELGLTPAQEPEQQAKKSVFTADELGLVAPKEETALPSAQEPFHKVDLKQLGIETDPDQQIINTLIGSKAAASGAANDKARQLAEERLAFAKDKAQRAMRTGASADDAAEIFASSLTPVSTVEKSNINLPSNAKEIAKNTFMRAIKSGVAGYQSMGADIADLLSDEDTARSLLGKAQESREAAAEYPAAVPTIQQARNPKETLTFLLEGMGENLPALIESMFGAGAGRILAMRGAASLVKGLSDDVALKLTEKLAKYGTIAGAGTTSIAQESGSIYQDIYDETGQMRPGVATAFGTLAGALDSIMPATAVNTAFKKQMIEDLGKSIIERYGVGALKAISEESATEFLQTFIEKGGVSYVDGRPVFTKENFNEALNAAVIGAGLGGGTSLVSQGISDAQLKAQGITREQAKAYLESEQVSEEAKQAALNKWKTSGLTQGLQRPETTPDIRGRVEPTISELPEVAAAAAPQVEQPTPQVEPLQPAYEGEEIPAELASNPEFVSRVKQYESLGYTRENAILVAKQDLADMEVQNGTPTVPGTDREGIEVSGGPAPIKPTGGVAESVGTGMVGSGESTGTIEEGTLQQPTALEAPRVNISDLKRPNGEIGTQGFTPDRVIDLINHAAGTTYDTNGSLREVLTDLKSKPELVEKVKQFIESTPVDVTTLPDGELHLEDGHHRAFLADQLGMESIPTSTEKVQPQEVVQDQAASEIPSIEQSRIEIQALTPEYATPEEAQAVLKTMPNPGSLKVAETDYGFVVAPKQTAPKEMPTAVQPSEETATIEQINQTLGQMFSPTQLKRNPPIVVNDYDDLPVSDDIKQQARDGDVKSFVDPTTKKAYYIASQMQGNEIKGTILHEQGGHIGLANLIGAKRIGRLSNQVLKWSKGDGTLENKIAKEAIKLANASGEEAGSQRFEEEVIAYFTEIAVNRYGIDPLKTYPKEKAKVAGWLRELWNGVMASIRKFNMDPSTLTAQDVVTLVQGAARVGTGSIISAETKAVFTPKVVQELLAVMANNAPPVEDATKEPEPKIQASAKDLINKLGVSGPGVFKTFIETFYDDIKRLGANQEGVKEFIREELRSYPEYAMARVSEARVLAQVPKLNLYNLYKESYATKAIWENPAYAAAQASNTINRYRGQNVEKSANAVKQSMVTGGYGQHREVNNILRNEFDVGELYASAILLNRAIAKYTMAGNKLVPITESNEYLPITEYDISLDFLRGVLSDLKKGTPLKHAFKSAYETNILSKRNEVIQSQLGDSETGWLHFSSPEEANNLRLVTSDTGTATQPWCIGQSNSFSEGYLQNNDVDVFVDNGKSIVATLVDKNTGVPVSWFGLGSSQSVPTKDEPIKATHPRLQNAEAVEAANKEAYETEKTKQEYSEAESFLHDVAAGDMRAVRSFVNGYLNRDFENEAVRIAVRSIQTNFSPLMQQVTKITQPVLNILDTALENKSRVDLKNNLTVKDLYPELEGLSQYNEIPVMVKAIDISTLPPPEVTAEFDALTTKYDLPYTANEIFYSAWKTSGKLDTANFLDGNLNRLLTEAVQAQSLSGKGTPEPEEKYPALAEIWSWFDRQPRLDAEAQFNINQNANEEKTFLAYMIPNDPSRRGVAIKPTQYVVEDIYEANGLSEPAESYYSRHRQAKKQVERDIVNSAILAISELATNPPYYKGPASIQASRRQKPDEILAKIDISEYPERMGTALGRLIKARSFEEARKPLRAIFHAGDLKLITATLPTMTTMQITDLVGEDIPHLPQVNKLVQKMSVMRTRMLAALAETAEPWEKFQRNNPEGSRILARLMNYATLAEIDPTLHSDVNEALRKDVEINELRDAMQNATNPRARANFLGQINKRERRIRTAYTMWNKLGNYQNGKGKEIFNRVRDHYKAQFNLHRALLEDRIASANVPGDVKDASTPKGKLMAAIRLTYARAKEVGVYFPLMRYGNFWVRVGTGKNKEFYMFQSETDRNLFVEDRVEQLRRAGDSRGRDEMMQDGDLDYGNDMTKLRRDVEESSEMLKQIFSIIDTQGTANKEELKDAVYQMFLTTLPDRDFRKQFTHRQGTAGFSSDALRNFARSGYSSASQMARLKFGPAITDEMDAAHAALQGNPNKPKLEIYLNEVGRRVGEEVAPLNPDNSMLESLSTIGNQAAFFWLLTSGASALTNITAIPIFGYPVLGSNYGYGRTSVVLGKYLALYNHMTIRSEDQEGKHWIAPSVGESKHVKTNPILAAAYDVAHNELNITDVTRTFDMLSMARMPSTSYQNKFQRGTRFVVRASGALFHHSERMIREIMFMGGFELAYEKALKDGLAGGINGEAFTRAIKEAEKYTYQSMFNYQKYDRPSIMRGPLKKMAFQFALYKQQVIAFYVRNFYTMLKGSDLDPEARSIAAKQYIGAMLMTGLFGGITGLFGFNAIMNVVQGLLEAMHDDDEPTYIEDRDLNLWFKTKFLPEHFGDNSNFADIMGQNEWNVILEKGPVAALSNVDIASRVSQADIWFRDNQYDASSDAQFSEFILSQLGPAVGLVRSAPRIYDDFRSGHFNEGVNKMLPAFAKGLHAQYVWGEEGVMTKNKRTYVLTPDEVTPSMRFWKFVGFNPTELSRIQDANYRVGTLINKAEDRRAQILDRLFLEFDRGDEKGFGKALEEVEKFNLDNPGKHLRIKPSTYLDSIKSKEKIKVMADHGLVVPKGMEYEIYSLVYPTRPKDKE